MDLLWSKLDFDLHVMITGSTLSRKKENLFVKVSSYVEW